MLFDLGVVTTKEPFKKLRHPGTVLAYSFVDAAGRYHAAELAPTGRIVIDAHRRVTREQARVIDALASLLNARGAPLPDEHLR